MSDDNIRQFPPRGTYVPLATPPTPSDEEFRQQRAAMQDQLEKAARVRLAKELLVAGRVATVEDAFKLADAFADEALRRLPHPPADAPLVGVGFD